MIVVDHQSGYSCRHQDKQVLDGCLCYQECQALFSKHRVSKIVSSVWWRALQAEEKKYAVVKR